MQLPTTVNNLYIDEATMIDYMQIIRLLQLPFKKIFFLGDQN